MVVTRRCLGCHSVDTTTNLVRCVARDNRVIVDWKAREAGRGAWVHPRRECIESSQSKRAWSRALKQSASLDLTALAEITGSRDPDGTG